MRVVSVVVAGFLLSTVPPCLASPSAEASLACRASSSDRPVSCLDRAAPSGRLLLAQGAGGGGGAGGGSGDGGSYGGGNYGDGNYGGGTYGRPYYEDDKQQAVEDGTRACRQATAQRLAIDEADVTQVVGAIDEHDPRLVRVHWTVNQTRGDCSFEYGRVTFWGVAGQTG